MVLSSHNKTHPLTTIIKIPVEKSKKPKERKRKQIGNKQTVLLQIKKNGAFTRDEKGLSRIKTHSMCNNQK